MLAAELQRHRDAKGREWAHRLAPLALAFAGRFKQFLPLADYPVRAGAHTNTAFALLLARDYAGVCSDTQLARLCDTKARDWYGADAACQAWEPSQDDFLSPALSEAALLSQVQPEEEFRSWFALFLPCAAAAEPRTLFTPARVSDRTDGKIAHLDGLNLSRAWCWRLIAARLEESDPVRTAAEIAIAKHLDSALTHVTGDYMGEHWLASFALLALDPVP
jgi:hypothetical protein